MQARQLVEVDAAVAEPLPELHVVVGAHVGHVVLDVHVGLEDPLGEALNRADSIGARLSQAKLDAQTQRSGAEDLDMVSAISDFQNKQTGYDAALKMYSTIQHMTLFDYIK